MKKHTQLIVIIVIGFILVRILKPNQWDIMVYSLLTLILFISSGQEVWRMIKTRKGVFVDGCISQVESSENDDEIKRIIGFVSPTDNVEYTINDVSIGNKYLVTQLPSKVKVWVNVKDPQKSLVAKEFDGMVFLSLSGKIIFAIFFLIMVIISW